MMVHTGNLRDDATTAGELGVLRLAVNFDYDPGPDEFGHPRRRGMLQLFEVSEPGEPCALEHGTWFRYEYGLWHQMFADVMQFAISRGAMILFEEE
jgi:hypothetical protein